jgi:hypothetical protein
MKRADLANEVLKMAIVGLASPPLAHVSFAFVGQRGGIFAFHPVSLGR